MLYKMKEVTLSVAQARNEFANVLNHFQPGTPSLNLDSPQSFGHITTQANTPRQIEFGLKLRF